MFNPPQTVIHQSEINLSKNLYLEFLEGQIEKDIEKKLPLSKEYNIPSDEEIGILQN